MVPCALNLGLRKGFIKSRMGSTERTPTAKTCARLAQAWWQSASQRWYSRRQKDGGASMVFRRTIVCRIESQQIIGRQRSLALSISAYEKTFTNTPARSDFVILSRICDTKCALQRILTIVRKDSSLRSVRVASNNLRRADVCRIESTTNN